MSKELRVALLAAIVTGIVATAVSAQVNPIYEAKGFQANHDYFSAMPFEHIDTATGALILRFTDLALPGNGGRVLRFQRTYNSKDNQWTYGIEGVPLEIHFVWPPVAPLSDDPDPLLEMPDGGLRAMAFQLIQEPTVEGRRIMLDDRFWKFDRQERILWMPDGRWATYTSGHLDTMYDPSGRTLLKALWSGHNATFHHYVSDTEYREIFTTASDCAGFACEPRTMTYEGRQWTYTRDHPVVRAQLPEGVEWKYEDLGTSLTVTTPHGGRIEYIFEDHEFPNVPSWGEVTTTEVLTLRKTFDQQGNLIGAWTYDYDLTEVIFSTRTAVTGPDGTVTTFDHEFLGGTHDAYQSRAFVVTRRVVTSGLDVLETETRTYQQLPAPVLTIPELERRTIIRGTGTYTTTYCYGDDNYADFYHPNKIIETGELLRTTVRAYAHTAGAPGVAVPYVLGMPTVDRVTVGAAAADCTADPIGGQTVETTRSYNTATGFVESETAYGITTTFTPDPFGNVARITRANGTWLQQAYTNGQVSSVTTSEPGYQISRVVNPDGTVGSETVAGRTTGFLYDDLGRLERVEPPLGNPTVTTYAPASVTTTRGAAPVVSQVVSTLDGFGRVVRTEDTAGVRTRTRYDAQGRVAYQSLPFVGAFEGPTDLGTRFTYDQLGRIRREEHADGAAQTFEYSGNVTTARDENNRATVLTRQAFGQPDDARLSSLVDPAGQVWSYAYDALGQLTSVSAPDAVTRTWVYDAVRPTLLRSETHPESGTISFPTYDAAGMLQEKQDANGNIFVYEHDGNDRLKKISAGSFVTEITYEPGSDNRQKTVVDGVTSEFAYDAAGRLQTRTDTVDGKPFITSFVYDGNDNLAEITYPSGRKVAYQYGAENRLARVYNPATNADYATEFDYHPSGAPARFKAGNGIVTTMTYDPNRYWVTGIAAGEMQLGYGSYDGVGNVRSITDPWFGTQTLTYDAVDRLDSAVGAYGSIDFNYDAHGNRQAPNLTYSPTNRFRLEAFGNMPMTYDANGNLRTRSADSFDYTPTNLVKSATVGGVTTSYAYDADAWRVKKSVAGGATSYFVRAPNGQLLMEWVNTSPTATVREYIYAGSRLIAVMKGEVPPK